MGQLDGMVAIITGGGTGIGKGIAYAFANEGATVVIASRNEEVLKQTAQALRLHGGTVGVVPTDVTNETDVIKLFEQTTKEFGSLDILVNNAGVFDGGPLHELSLETWQKVINVNLTGVFLCSREAMKIMRRQRRGRIINIGSISAHAAKMDSLPYIASKHGLVGLTKATALEGRPFGVMACCLHPGDVNTEPTGGGDASAQREQIMDPEDVATVALTMAALPRHANILEATMLAVAQPYLGRG